MSVLAVSDFMFGSLLTELKMKPWWETFHGYCFAASVAIALFLTYLFLPTPDVRCLPSTGNETLQKQFSAQESSFVNNICGNQLPWYIGYAGIISIVCTVIIIIFSSYWLHHPDIINSFRTFSRAEELIESVNLSVGDLKTASYKPLDSEIEENVKVRKACLLLWNYTSNAEIYTWYFVRNLLLLLSTIAAIGISTYILILIGTDNDMFLCNLARDKDFNSTIATYNMMTNNFCSHNASRRLFPFVVSYIITLAAQSLFILIGIYKMTKCRESIICIPVTYGSEVVGNIYFTAHGTKAAAFSQFMVKFWKNSRPVSSGSFAQFVSFIFYDVLNPIKQNLRSALSLDKQLVEVYSVLKKGGGNEILTIIHDILERRNFLYDSTYAMLCDVVNCLKGELSWNQNLEILLQKLYDQQLWEMFVLIISLPCWTKSQEDNIIQYLINLKINPNQIGRPYIAERSILFYAMSATKNGTVNVDGTRRIFSAMIDGEHKFVHYGGITKRAEQFFIEDSWNTPGGYLAINQVLGFVRISENTKESENTEKSENTNKSLSVSEEMIGSLILQHCNKTALLKPRYSDVTLFEHKKSYEKYIKYITNFAKKISYLKFTKWDENTKKLLKYAYDEKQWIIFVELLNSFIDEKYMTCNRSDSFKSEIDCGITEFDVSTRISEENILLHSTSYSGSILYYAMTKPEYRLHFVPTAARHILANTKNQEKLVRDEMGHHHAASKFVLENDTLTIGDRDMLQLLLQESDRGNLERNTSVRSHSSHHSSGGQITSRSTYNNQGQIFNDVPSTSHTNQLSHRTPITSLITKQSKGSKQSDVMLGHDAANLSFLSEAENEKVSLVTRATSDPQLTNSAAHKSSMV